MEIVYLAFGVLLYVVLIALITVILGQNKINPDRRSTDRRKNREDRRRSPREDGGACRRVGDRRSAFDGVPA